MDHQNEWQETPEKKSGFLFLPSYFEALRGLPPSDRHAILDAMIFYAFEDQQPRMNPRRMSVFLVVRANIDASRERYRRMSANGRKGGRPRKERASEARPAECGDTIFELCDKQSYHLPE